MKKATGLLKRPSFYGFFFFLLVFAIVLLSPGTVTDAAKSGLRLCAQVIIPSLFPFFVLSNLFVGLSYHRYIASALRPMMKPLFGLPGSAAVALVLGTVGGYPVGAGTIFHLYDRGELSAPQASRALTFCNNAGPGFLLGMVGMSLLGSVKLGMLLWGVHLLSALLVGLLFRPSGSRVTVSRAAADGSTKPAFSSAFVEAVTAATGSIVRICGFLVFFSVMMAFLQKTPLWQFAAGLVPFGGALLDGTLELSTGISHLISSDCSSLDAMTCSAFLLGWGGFCVHCQVLSLKGQRQISMAPYWIAKLLQGLLSAALIRLIAVPSMITLLFVLVLTVPGYLFRKVRTGNRALPGV